MDAELQSLRRKGPGTVARLQERAKLIGGGAAAAGDKGVQLGERNGDHVRVRLAEVVTIFGEVDRAAKRLEFLTEQRRECLREMTRQRALEDEINDVSKSALLILLVREPHYRSHKYILVVRTDKRWRDAVYR